MKHDLFFLASIIDLDQISSFITDGAAIQNYYWANQFAYSLVHDRKYLHMWFSLWGVFHKSDLCEPLKKLSVFLPKQPWIILELACWRWHNSGYLYSHYPEHTYFWCDLSDEQLSYSPENGVVYTKGNFHDLSSFSSESCDVVFIIEALCHSSMKELVFKEVFRVLKPWWKFVVIDWYGWSKILSKDELKALELTAKWMCVYGVEPYLAVCDYAEWAWFELNYEEDVSLAVLPSMERLKRRTSWLWNLGMLSRNFFSFFPRVFSGNYVAAYLMPTLIVTWAAEYWFSVFEKK